MIIIDPVSLGDVTFSRASPKWAFDKTGSLVQVPANALAVTYDPSDLGQAPYALVEQEATNYVRNNTMQGAIVGTSALPRNWGPSTNVSGMQRQVMGLGQEDGIDYVDIRFFGTVNNVAVPEYTIMFDSGSVTPAGGGQKWASSYFAMVVSGTSDVVANFEQYIIGYRGNATMSEAASALHPVRRGSLRQNRLGLTATLTSPETAFVVSRFDLNLKPGAGIIYDVDVVVRIGLPQLERDRVTSPIKTASVFVRRSSPGTYIDGTGALQTAAIDVERISYDPANANSSPYRLWENGATNNIRNNTMQGALAGSPGTLPNYWQWGTNVGLSYQIVRTGIENGVEYVDVRIYGDATGAGFAGVYFGATTEIPAAAGQVWTASVYCRAAGGSLDNVSSVNICMDENSATQSYVTGGSDLLVLSGPLFPQSRGLYNRTISGASTAYVGPHIKLFPRGAGAVDLTLRIGLPQMERDRLTSVIKTSSAAVGRAADEIANPTVTRAADIIGAGAGLVYSNVPITEPNYDSATTYAKDAMVHDPATHNTFQSLIAANKGKALTDTTAWTPRGATSRWAMLDQYNNTQTTAQDEILLVVSPKAISRGFYIGNTDAVEVRISVVDLYKGLVYQEVQSLKMSTSKSSFYNWCFNRIRRRSWAVSLKLPPYYSALVTILIRKPGGTAACGMCAIGPTMDLGKTLMGLGAEIKDFSETSFQFDGTSTTKKRNWAKRITADIVVDSNQVEAVYEELARLRQKPLVWVGSPKFGLSIAFGRYSGIKPVIKGATRWDMAAQIEGTV